MKENKANLEDFVPLMLSGEQLDLIKRLKGTSLYKNVEKEAFDYLSDREWVNKNSERLMINYLDIKAFDVYRVMWGIIKQKDLLFRE